MPNPAGDARDRRSTNVTRPVELVSESKPLNIDVSQACERGLALSVAQARGDRWLKDSREAIDAYNTMVERDGLPLDRVRQF